MSNKTSLASSTKISDPPPGDLSELAASVGEARRQLTSEVKVRRDIIKPLEQALRALKDLHRNAVALYERRLSFACGRLTRACQRLALRA